MKKLLYGFLAVLFLLVCSVPFSIFNVAATSEAKVKFNDVSARKGSTIDIVVTLYDSPNVKALAVEPIYDEEKLEYVYGEWLIDGGLLRDWDQAEQNGVLLYTSEQDVNGDIAKFSFRVKEHASWEDIEFSVRVVLKDANGNMEVSVNPLSIYIICDHVWDEIEHREEPTCTEKGYTYWLCTICSREKQLAELVALGHNASDWIVDEESTILQNGKRHKECTRCGLRLEEEQLPLLGQCIHNWSTEVFLKESTCITNGSVYKKCTICMAQFTVYELTKLPHIPGEWIVDNEATFEASGSKHKECVECEEILAQESIPQLIQEETPVTVDILVVVLISIGCAIFGAGIASLIFIIVAVKRKNKGNGGTKKIKESKEEKIEIPPSESLNEEIDYIVEVPPLDDDFIVED